MTWYASKTRVPYRHFPLSKGKELAIAVVAGDLASLEYAEAKAFAEKTFYPHFIYREDGE